MAVSARSQAMRSPAGYTPRGPSTTAYKPPTYKAPNLSAGPTLARDASLPGYAERQWLQAQLGEIPNQYNARYTNIRAGAQQALAGYGGYKFREDDPNTPEREDLILDFDAGMGLGEREQAAVRQQRNLSNSTGTLYSSFHNQNVGDAVQRLSLEAQRVATQYATDIASAQRDEANTYAEITGRYAQLYGSDATYALENPPPPPDPLAGLQRAADQAPIIWTGSAYPNLETLRGRYPGYPLGVRRMGNGGYAVVIGSGGAEPPKKKRK